MKTSNAIIVIIIVVLLGIFAYVWSNNYSDTVTEVIPTPNEEKIEGCYIVRNSNDVYTLNIKSQTGENVSGTLAFKNYQKDSSSGTFNGTYEDGILLGEYAFQSEGMSSLMQVIFKKSGDDFIRGYGDVSADGTRFVDPSKVTYDSSSVLAVFKKETCPITP